jgi:hypothetical protein
MKRLLVIWVAAMLLTGCESASPATDTETETQGNVSATTPETSDAMAQGQQGLVDADSTATGESDVSTEESQDTVERSEGTDAEGFVDTAGNPGTDLDVSGPESDDIVTIDTLDAIETGSMDVSTGSDAGTPSAECSEPNPEGCKYQGCPDGQICDVAVGCLPSKCTCDEMTGVWACTKDCTGGTCVEPGASSDACKSKNPEGCVNSGCELGYTCDTVEGCFPSSCACDADVGLWICTEDCGGGICIPEDPAQSACSTSNPAGCVQIGCKTGYVCDTNEGDKPSFCECDAAKDEWICSADTDGGMCMPSSMLEYPCKTPNPAGCLSNKCPMGSMCDTTVGCYPSTCKCDMEIGDWVCVEDCGGGMCVAAEEICGSPNPAGCALTGCPPGEKCDLSLGDKPAACKCAPIEAEWVCTPDQNGGECAPKEEIKPLCEEPNPVGCVATGCADGFDCDPTAGCAPSSCTCDGTSGNWVCASDCEGGTCVPKDELTQGCGGPNPQGCDEFGCAAGEICDPTVGCFPSSCSCDESNGTWFCTGDCDGGQCMPNPMSECAPNTVDTMDGCLSCQEISQKIATKLEGALLTYSACTVDSDCSLVFADTACKGACQVSVSTEKLDEYLATKQEISDYYCSSNYVDVCGYATPGCAPAVAFCDDGTCMVVVSF